MKEHPILFSAPMIRALLDGRKTQTRRVVKPRHGGKIIAPGGEGIALEQRSESHISTVLCPYGQPGDRLWVRENYCPIYPQNPHYNGGRPIEYDYAATYKHGYRLGDLIGEKKKWKPSIHMPRIASRILLEITAVRVERLNDISEADADAEGIETVQVSETDFRYVNYLRTDRTQYPKEATCGRPVLSYATLWESINGPDSWDANPWVWVVEFRRV